MTRQYDWRFPCPKCGKRYAKKTFWMRHIKTHSTPPAPKEERCHICGDVITGPDHSRSHD